MILLVDNYDSFTYNLQHLLLQFGREVDVIRNDEIDPQKIIDEHHYKAIVISPGPSHPENAGQCLNLIKTVSQRLPILGVCLGHQCLAQAFGARIVKAPKPVHGQVDQIQHNGQGLFFNVPQNFYATRYHSLIVDRESLTDDFHITATNSENLIMAIEHKVFPCLGVQFHPESVMTRVGIQLIDNFFKRYV